MPKRPFAAFDIDGTLIRWQTYHTFADLMAKKGHLPAEEYLAVQAMFDQWKSRKSPSAYVDYENSLIKLMDQAAIGMDHNLFIELGQQVSEVLREQVYTFSRDLIAALKESNYLVFAVSGSSEEMVQPIAEYYGFDDYRATTYRLHNGRIAGHKRLMIEGNKKLAIEELVNQHGASKQGSIAMGDTYSDRFMLAEVSQPIAFNPAADLARYAQSKHWDIVVERKNMVYRLHYQDGRYLFSEARPAAFIPQYSI